jgi:hypothetical protein
VRELIEMLVSGETVDVAAWTSELGDVPGRLGLAALVHPNSWSAIEVLA